MQRICILKCFAVIGALALSSHASASIVVGGSALLSQAYADQLESWLGEGPIAITRIFAKQAGDDSYDFHAAADGKGRTFSVVEVLANRAYDYTTNLSNNQAQIIGGYNPQSWQSVGGYNITNPDADRTAFLFNLTSDEIHRQSLSTEAGSGNVQTYNSNGYGPTFGAGHELYIANDLTFGHMYNYSYGGTAETNDILSGPSYYHYGYMFGAIEVFTIAAAPIDSAVPEPLSLLVWATIAVAGGLVTCRRQFGAGNRRCRATASCGVA